MNTAVEDHSGPCSTALTSCPIQLSQAVMLTSLWQLLSTSGPPGVTTEKLGSVPAPAAVRKSASGTRLAAWLVSRHSANEGQIDQIYPPCVLFAPYSFQVRPTVSSRSMIVGMFFTGVCSNAPPNLSPGS